MPRASAQLSAQLLAGRRNYSRALSGRRLLMWRTVKQRAIEARHNFVQVDAVYAHMTVPGSTPEEWLDAGQARDMYLPAFNYRPQKSVQYGLALQNHDDPENPLRVIAGALSPRPILIPPEPAMVLSSSSALNTTDSTGRARSVLGRHICQLCSDQRRPPRSHCAPTRLIQLAPSSMPLNLSAPPHS